MAKLTAKQERFVREYLVDLNATEAAKRAGYSGRTAYSIGSENLSKPEIAAAIAKAQGKVAEKLELSAESVVEGISNLIATCIADGDYAPAMRGYQLLGQHLGMFKQLVELTINDLSSRLEQARNRARTETPAIH